ncbi:MAG: amidophosphoribosyltransferase, partial [Gemmatimonadota bacterium]
GATHSIEEIRAYLGVDSLGYLSLDGMLQAAGQENEDTGHFCHACFSGDYPTPLHEDLVQLRRVPTLATVPA